MFPHYFNSQIAAGDQLQSNSGQRADPRYRQDGTRPPQLQNPYSAINMGSNVTGQQFDPRFMGAVNSGIPPNTTLPYNMVSNVYADGMKNMQIPFDRGMYHYPMPMPMMDLRTGGYPNMNGYYGYYDIRQGMPYPMDRQMIPGYPQEFSASQNQDRTASAKATSSSELQPTAPEPVKQLDVSSAPGSKDATQSKPDQESGTKELTTETGEFLLVIFIIGTNDASIELQLANMLLQIKGKSRESFASAAQPKVGVPSSRPYSASSAPDDKRVRTNDPSVGYSVPFQQIPPSLSFMQPKTGAAHSSFPTQQSHYPYSYQAPLSQTQPPPIPPPTAVHQTPKAPVSVGDYYVFCTVCRHGTPINVTKPIPDTFKCSNCGFACTLDKHLLSYYVCEWVRNDS